MMTTLVDLPKKRITYKKNRNGTTYVYYTLRSYRNEKGKPTSDEKSIGKVKLGQLVYIQFNTDKNNVYEGKISEIVAAFDEKTQSFIVKVLLNEAAASSIYGTQLEANILTSEKKNALLIPRSYLGFGNKVKLKGKDEPIVVKTGIISTEYVEILEGISKDDILEHIKL